MNKTILTVVRRLALGVTVALVVTGCNDSDDKDIKVYRTVTETPPADAQATPPTAPADQGQALPPGHSGMPDAQPRITWTLPTGWQEAGPGQMSVVSFKIAGDAGASAEVAITPLSGLSGKEAALVNMWRQQVGQSQLSDDEALKELSPVEVGGVSGKMFEVAGKSDSGAPMKIVTAIMPRGDVSWFYKLSGDAALVDAQKTAFAEFLKSVKIEDAPAAVASAPVAGLAAPPQGLPAMGDSAAPDQGGTPGSQHWTVPSDWKTLVPGAMQMAKFAVPDKDGAKADVMVSTFPSATGGTVANVNRWRRQIGLAPLTEDDLPTMSTVLDAKIPDSVLVDLSNNNRRLIGAIVPRDGQWYFYKLLGDAGAVGPQKDAFIAFAKSQP